MPRYNKPPSITNETINMFINEEPIFFVGWGSTGFLPFSVVVVVVVVTTINR